MRVVYLLGLVAFFGSCLHFYFAFLHVHSEMDSMKEQMALVNKYNSSYLRKQAEQMIAAQEAAVVRETAQAAQARGLLLETAAPAAVATSVVVAPAATAAATAAPVAVPGATAAPVVVAETSAPVAADVAAVATSAPVAVAATDAPAVPAGAPATLMADGSLMLHVAKRKDTGYALSSTWEKSELEWEDDFMLTPAGGFNRVTVADGGKWDILTNVCKDCSCTPSSPSKLSLRWTQWGTDTLTSIDNGLTWQGSGYLMKVKVGGAPAWLIPKCSANATKLLVQSSVVTKVGTPGSASFPKFLGFGEEIVLKGKEGGAWDPCTEGLLCLKHHKKIPEDNMVLLERPIRVLKAGPGPNSWETAAADFGNEGGDPTWGPWRPSVPCNVPCEQKGQGTSKMSQQDAHFELKGLKTSSSRLVWVLPCGCFSLNKARLSCLVVALLVVNMNWVFVREPVDVVIFMDAPYGSVSAAGISSTMSGLPNHDAISAAWSEEGPGYYPHLRSFHKLATITETTGIDTDVPITYIQSGYVNSWNKPPTFTKAKLEAIGEDDKVVIFVARNCGARNNRQNFVEELGKHIGVASPSSCQHNTEWPNCAEGPCSKSDALKKYPFYLAFENSNEVDYVSEKVFEGMEASVLSIFMGASNIDTFVPPNSIIKTADFDDAKALADHLKYLIKNPDKYLEYFSWKTKPLPDWFQYKWGFIHAHDVCRTCRYAFYLRNTDTFDWSHDEQRFYTKGTCPDKVCEWEQTG